MVEAATLTGTFSILAVGEGSIGVAVASGSTSVGDRVPWVSKRGAVATQGYTNVRYGREGISLLKLGYDPGRILRKLLRDDDSPQRRQVAIIDHDRRKAVHTGSECPKETGSVTGTDLICIGNMLSNPEVPRAMADAYRSPSPFPARLVGALRAGSSEGGDRRGERSAALLVCGKRDIAIRISSSRTPIDDLGAKLRGLDSRPQT